MLARYYSSSLGRFMAVDPSDKSIKPENPQSWNRYAYTLNNPLRYVDPDGKTYTSKSGQEQHNKVVTDPNRTPTEKKVVGEGAAAPQPIDVEIVPEGKVTIVTKEGATLEATGDAGSIKDLTASQQKQGNFNEKPKAEEYSGHVDKQTGNITDAKLTIYAGSYDISAGGAAAGRTKDQFVTDSFIHGTAHVSGQKERSETEVKTLVGY